MRIFFHYLSRSHHAIFCVNQSVFILLYAATNGVICLLLDRHAILCKLITCRIILRWYLICFSIYFYLRIFKRGGLMQYGWDWRHRPGWLISVVLEILIERFHQRPERSWQMYVSSLKPKQCHEIYNLHTYWYVSQFACLYFIV